MLCLVKRSSCSEQEQSCPSLCSFRRSMERMRPGQHQFRLGVESALPWVGAAFGLCCSSAALSGSALPWVGSGVLWAVGPALSAGSAVP